MAHGYLWWLYFWKDLPSTTRPSFPSPCVAKFKSCVPSETMVGIITPSEWIKGLSKRFAVDNKRITPTFPLSCAVIFWTVFLSARQTAQLTLIGFMKYLPAWFGKIRGKYPLFNLTENCFVSQKSVGSKVVQVKKTTAFFKPNFSSKRFLTTNVN